MSANTLLILPSVMKERSTVHTNMDDKLIYPEIKYAQDLYIKPILGTSLFEKLQTIIGDGTISSDAANVNYKYLVDTYVIDSLIYFTMSTLCLTSSFQMWNKGLVRKHGDNTELPSMTETYTMGQEYKNRAEYYANRMRVYIQAENSALPTKFPEYYRPGSRIDTVVPEQDQFHMPIYLGDEYHRCIDLTLIRPYHD